MSKDRNKISYELVDKFVSKPESFLLYRGEKEPFYISISDPFTSLREMPQDYRNSTQTDGCWSQLLLASSRSQGRDPASLPNPAEFGLASLGRSGRQHPSVP